MESLIKRKLYIIGNGFDLAHGLPTKYSDFYGWLRDTHYEMNNSNDCTFFVGIIDQIFEHTFNNVDLWSDFENALGNLDINKFIKTIVNCNIIEDIEDECYNDRGYLREQVENEVSYIFTQHGLDNMRTMFQKWVLNIPNYEAVQPYFTDEDIENTGLFLTFNYTDTLERVYKINPKQVLHIHGYVNQPDSDIIVGHESEYSLEDCKLTEKDLFSINLDVFSPLFDSINSLKKDTQQIIQKNKKWFDDLKKYQIQEIHLYGLSFGEIDDAYYKEIYKQLPNIKWVFAVYDDRNISYIQNFVDRIGISHENCSAFDQESICNDEIPLF